MLPSETVELSLKLPGVDYSKSKYSGPTDPSLILDFAAQAKRADPDDFSLDLGAVSADEILKKLGVYETGSAGILFGDHKYRVVHFDSEGEIFDQKDFKGLYRILTEGFIEEIQSWTRRQGTIVEKNSVAAVEETPYPLKALREVLGNAVAHSLYQKQQGDVVIELHPNRITVRNNCSLEAKAFVDKWFSRVHKVVNKHLMNVLRIPRFTDEQGTGKIRVFRQMLEAGKKEPVAEFVDLKDYGRWSVTLFNDESNAQLRDLIVRIRDNFPTVEEARIAAALLLWREKRWSQIKEYLDEYYIHISELVLKNPSSPVSRWNDQIFVKRWALIALTQGQITKQFTEGEEVIYRKLLNMYAYGSNAEGHISAEQARTLIGLSSEPSEMTQMSNLFRKWQAAGIIEKVKKGHWRFCSRENNDLLNLPSLTKQK